MLLKGQGKGDFDSSGKEYKNSLIRFVFSLIPVFVIAACLITVRLFLIVDWHIDSLAVTGQPRHDGKKLLMVNNEGVLVEGLLSANLPRLHAVVYSLKVDGCIQNLKINNVLVEGVSGRCGEIRRLNLRGYVKTGRNSIRLTYRSYTPPHGAYFGVSNSDAYLIFIWVLAIFMGIRAAVSSWPRSFMRHPVE